MFLFADPSCMLFLLQLQKYDVLWMLLAYHFFPLYQHPIVYTVAWDKNRVFFDYC